MGELVRCLEAHTEARRCQFREGFAPFVRLHNLIDWERWFSPCTLETYRAVLGHIAPNDMALEIGAGDLRLAPQMVEQAQRVYAVEVNPSTRGVCQRP
jgi:predicted RNA methylase